jgi:bifunctional non-homologous end joining protein LigD
MQKCWGTGIVRALEPFVQKRGMMTMAEPSVIVRSHHRQIGPGERAAMASSSTTWELAGRAVRVTSLEKPYWPKDGLTKGDLLEYYRELAPTLLPYFAERPVTTKLYPRGIDGPSYYRRERPEKAPEWLRGAEYETATDGHTIQVLLVDDAAGLIWLANSGAIELHVWGAHLPDLSEPDMVVFDLDPGEAATFGDVLRAATVLHECLDRLGLRGYPKTSGGDGLHVFLPLAPGHTFEQVRDWVKGLAEELEAAHPKLIAVSHGPTHRGSRVTVDHAQNSVGRNSAAPYTVRARPGAPVSTPLTWDEVEDGKVRPGDLTITTVPARVRQLGDVFAPVLAGDQRLPG